MEPLTVFLGVTTRREELKVELMLSLREDLTNVLHHVTAQLSWGESRVSRG
jgi:hypothetical protein